MDDEVEWFHPEYDPADFRRVASRFVKLLIRARWKADPNFRPVQLLASWHLQDIYEDTLDSCQLMRQAALALAVLNREYVPRCGSGGVAITSQKTPLGRLIAELPYLAPEGVLIGDGYLGGAPDHNSTLLIAAAKLGRGEPVDWDQIVDWEKLPGIRRDLDELPGPNQSFTPGPTSSRYVFDYEGTICRICFGGREAQAIAKPRTGLFYLWVLIQKAPQKFSAAELVAARTRYFKSEVLSSSGQEHAFSDEEDVDVDDAPRPYVRKAPKDDSCYVNELRDGLRNKMTELEAAKIKGEKLEIITNIEKEISVLEITSRNQTWHGKPISEEYRTRKNQSDSVRRAIQLARTEQLAVCCPELSRHLEAAIKMRDGFRYAPETNLNWET